MVGYFLNQKISLSESKHLKELEKKLKHVKNKIKALNRDIEPEEDFNDFELIISDIICDTSSTLYSSLRLCVCCTLK